MTAAGTVRFDHEERFTTGLWGMGLFIATEAALFALLLFSYFYLQVTTQAAWPPDGPPELRLALPNTAILLASSLTLWWGERSLRRGKQGAFRAGLAITFLLGAVFLTIQGFEWAGKGFTPASHAYGSLFFTVTGFHGLHVVVGLLMNLFVQARAWRGHFDAGHHGHVTAAGWYWHFVDLVWIAVFTSLYLSPRFL